MLDEEGYRPNVAIVLCNAENKVLWARRAGHDGWQFPQGGIGRDESPSSAMYRELYEEIGLQPQHVRLLGRTGDWLRYEIPDRYSSSRGRGAFKGQKQIWFLLRLLADDKMVCLDNSPQPEFDAWAWVDYWQPLARIISFKREVYRRALEELHPYLTHPPGGRHE